MDDPERAEALYKMIQNLAVISNQNCPDSNHKSGMDPYDLESEEDSQSTRYISDSRSVYTKRSLSSKSKLKTLQEDEDSDSYSCQSIRQSSSLISLSYSQPIRLDSEIEGLRMKSRQSSKYHSMIIDTDGLLEKGSSRTRQRIPMSEKERLVDLIKVAAGENFALRESNVKFQQQRKLQILKVRDLKFKISQQNQKISQQKAEERMIWDLENTIRAKQLEIQSFKRQIKSVQEKFHEHCTCQTEVEMRPKKPVVRKELKRVKSRGPMRRPVEQIGDMDHVQSLASKLNDFLVQVAQLKNSAASSIRFLEKHKE